MKPGFCQQFRPTKLYIETRFLNSIAPDCVNQILTILALPGLIPGFFDRQTLKRLLQNVSKLKIIFDHSDADLE